MPKPLRHIESILDRFDAAYESSMIFERVIPGTDERVLIVPGGMYTLMHLVSPNDYPLVRRDPHALTSAPGSPRRISEYRQRVQNGMSLHSPGDRNDLTNALIIERMNGFGLKVLGRIT